jgi:hypothetical protein
VTSPLPDGTAAHGTALGPWGIERELFAAVLADRRSVPDGPRGRNIEEGVVDRFHDRNLMERQLRAADRVNAAMLRMQIAASDAVPDRALAQPELAELRMRHGATLGRNKRPELSTWR